MTTTNMQSTMKNYDEQIKPDWDLEIAVAAWAESNVDPPPASRHSDRAHVLGQNSTWLHTQTHTLMMRLESREPSSREDAEQLFRIVGAVTTNPASSNKLDG